MDQTKIQYTPGPWTFYADLPSTEPNWHIVTNESRRRVLANVHIEPGNEMDLANARLIVSAPDLLAACKAFMARYHNKIVNANLVFGDVAQQMEEAIAKAEGR